ncbi:MAG: hypothetical protein FJZ56_03045 [Chlamydiae bacterium]|nr:hypothetical protein [Chlamydiota bacterium]
MSINLSALHSAANKFISTSLNNKEDTSRNGSYLINRGANFSSCQRNVAPTYSPYYNERDKAHQIATIEFFHLLAEATPMEFQHQGVYDTLVLGYGKVLQIHFNESEKSPISTVYALLYRISENAKSILEQQHISRRVLSMSDTFSRLFAVRTSGMQFLEEALELVFDLSNIKKCEDRNFDLDERVSELSVLAHNLAISLIEMPNGACKIEQLPDTQYQNLSIEEFEKQRYMASLNNQEQANNA